LILLSQDVCLPRLMESKTGSDALLPDATNRRMDFHHHSRRLYFWMSPIEFHFIPENNQTAQTVCKVLVLDNLFQRSTVQIPIGSWMSK
jgi:hypothetical protein